MLFFDLALVVSALTVLVVGSITDLQKREVADWVNYSFLLAAIALRLLYSVVTMDVWVIISGALGFVLFTAFGMAMFYLGQWGGGDTKMLMGLGVLFGLDIFTPLLDSMLISFLINSLILGSLYGLLWSIGIIIKNREKFVSNWRMTSAKLFHLKIIFLTLGVLAVIIALFLRPLQIILIPLALLLFALLYSYIFTKSIEKGCMVHQLPPSKITEGDWIDKEVVVKGKYICGPKDLGISKKQISLLKRLKVRNVPVKIGIPFVPSFLFGFLVTILVGNVLHHIVNFVLSLL